MISAAVEDYLKAIYELLNEGEGVASTSKLAEKLEISRASVTGMLKKLDSSSPKLVTYRRYRGATLTPAGEKIALEVIRHHRLIECYLSQALGYTWDEVHGEADRLEHVISEELEERIASALGYPTTDPHGSPIPHRDGSIDIPEERCLSDLEAGDRAVITRVSDHNPALLRYLEELGLTLNVEIEVESKGAFGGPLFIRSAGSTEIHALNQTVTDHIFTTQCVR